MKIVRDFEEGFLNEMISFVPTNTGKLIQKIVQQKQKIIDFTLFLFKYNG